MPLYESVIIARQDVSAQAAEALADKFAAILTDLKGTIAKREYWGLRNLAYKIKKNRKGHYFLFNIDAPFEAIEEMERKMRLDEDILRYLTLRVDEHEEEPSVVMRNRGREDDERPRRTYGNNEGSNTSAPKAAATETSKGTSTETSKETSTKVSTETSTKVSTETSTGASAETSKETPDKAPASTTPETTPAKGDES